MKVACCMVILVFAVILMSNFFLPYFCVSLVSGMWELGKLYFDKFLPGGL